MEGDKMKIREELVLGALSFSGCADGMEQIRNASSKVDMVQCFLDRIDFCLAKDFPDKGFLKRNFENELRDRNIYIDEVLSLTNIRKSVLMGNCNTTLAFNKYEVGKVFAKHKTQLIVKAYDHARVMVDALDDSIISVECSGNAKVVVNLYARASVSSAIGNTIKIVRKNLLTYEL